MKQDSTLWEIVKTEDRDTIRPLDLFSMLKASIEGILRTFDRIRDRPHIIDGIVHHVWNTKNDNLPGAYNDYVKENFLYKTSEGRWDFDNPDFGYRSGFSLLTISKGASIDPQIADVEQIELITSPEAVIVELANRNLVFALSATGDIPRMVRSFNLGWIAENSPFIEPSSDDKSLIEQLKHEKAITRKREVNFCQNRELEEDHPLFRQLKQLKDIGFYAEQEENTDSQASTNRFHRSLRFFGCLDWIFHESKNRTHLIFLTTFGREKRIIGGDEIEDVINRQFEGFLHVQSLPIASEYGSAYTLQLGGKSANIFFLNAEAARTLEEAGNYEDYDRLFSEQDVDNVIMVTQYQTASNMEIIS